MTQFKITIHCGQVNTFAYLEFDSKDEALAHYEQIVKSQLLVRFGDVLINTKHITFVVVEDVIVKPVEASETIEV